MFSVRRIGVVAAVSVLFCCGALWPARGKNNKPKNDVVHGNQGQTVNGDFVERRVEQLNSSISWLSDFNEAKKLAQQQNRPIFWMHALGDIDGKT